MKIGTRFIFFQLTIVIGFLINASIVMILFTQADRLKELEVRAANSLTSLNNMIDKTSTLFGRGGSTSGLLWEDWRSSYKTFDYLFKLLEPASDQIIFLNSKSKKYTEIKKENLEFFN